MLARIETRRSPRPLLRTLRVHARPGGRALGRLTAGSLALPCMLGPGGLTHGKREGDGATPVGRFAVLGGFFRADRVRRPLAMFPFRASRVDDGWCDDPASARYNRPVRLPLAASHERMWREDRLYDLGLVVDFNLKQVRKGHGSAIFVHVMAEGATPTAGCVALRPGDLRRLLPRLARRCHLVIG